MKQEGFSTTLISLGRPLKKSANGWTNYLCPSCRDGKKDHFWVSPEMNLGYCHKCLKTWRIVQNHDTLPTSRWGSMSALKDAVKSALGPSQEKPRSLQYTPFLMESFYSTYETVEISETAGPIREDIKTYCTARNVYPGDLHNVGARVLIPKQAVPSSSNNTREKFSIFFPIYRGGMTVAGWCRVFEGNTKWIAHGMSDGNGSLLYTTALPDWAFDPNDQHAIEVTLFLVEGIMDAIRVCKEGYLAIALGGKNLTGKGKAELMIMPQQKVVVCLDPDAPATAVKLQHKVITFKKHASMVLWPTHEKGDPASMDSKQLHKMLSEEIK